MTTETSYFGKTQPDSQTDPAANNHKEKCFVYHLFFSVFSVAKVFGGGGDYHVSSFNYYHHQLDSLGFWVLTFHY